MNGNDMWLGTKGKGVYHIDANGNARLFYRSGDTGEDYVKHIAADGSKVWLGTINGLIILDRKTGNVINKYNIEAGLPHNSINQVYLLKEGGAVIATECDRLYKINESQDITVKNQVMSGMTKNIVLCYRQ